MDLAPKTIKQRFLAVNRDRLNRVREVLSPTQRQFVDLLPLIFHLNDANLPGFVSEDTPKGLYGYVPGRQTLDAARRVSRGFIHKKQALRSYRILALYMMGSAGTIAYSRKSDFDIWLMHDPGMEEPGLEHLRQKAVLIEKWGESLDLEVHFFLMDPEDLRAGRFGDLSTESSGTTQHQLLLDEFYRTALLVAGRFPLWWLIPPGDEANYDSYVNRPTGFPLVSEWEYVDLGSLAAIPASEFFGATLWQLYKGVSSPHKSVLKILLLEAYAAHYPDTELLSHRYKRRLHEGVTGSAALDPYVLMLEMVQEYLTENNDPERLDLARRCLYFKTQKPLSRNNGSSRTSPDWQQLRELVQAWDWDAGRIHTLDSREEWKIERVLDERRILVSALTRSYKFLSDFVRNQADLSVISQADMNILGRKLFATFERKAGKVEIINNGISQDISEPRLVIHHVQRAKQADIWILARDTGQPGQAGTGRKLKQSRNLMDLLAWSHLNGISTARTHFRVQPPASELRESELRAVLEELQRSLPASHQQQASMEELARPARPLRALLFINLGREPLQDMLRKGRHLTSERRDALNYGERQDNLALSFDYLFINNWHETLAYHYEGIEGLMECLAEHLRGGQSGTGSQPAPLRAHCYSAGRGNAIEERVQQLFDAVVRHFTAAGQDPAPDYIIKGARHYYALSCQDNAAQPEHLGSYPELLRYLGKPSASRRRIVFDRKSLKDSPLPVLYRLQRQGVVQFNYAPQGDECRLYILDEHGSLYQSQLPFHSEETLLAQFSRFLDAVRYRQNAEDTMSSLQSGSDSVEYYRLERTRNGEYLRHSIDYQRPAAAARYTNIQVIIQQQDDGSEFTLYCDGEEFSSLEHGEQLFHAAARHVLGLRASGATYPIYVTDIDLSGVAIQEEYGGHLQTIHFLHYKKRIEDRLNRVLEELSRQAQGAVASAP